MKMNPEYKKQLVRHLHELQLVVADTLLESMDDVDAMHAARRTTKERVDMLGTESYQESKDRMREYVMTKMSTDEVVDLFVGHYHSEIVEKLIPSAFVALLTPNPTETIRKAISNTRKHMLNGEFDETE